MPKKNTNNWNRTLVGRCILFTLFLLLFCGCERKHIYVSFFGTIDTDTMPPITDVDGKPFYIVHTHKIDSLTVQAMGLEGAYFVDFYKPSDNSYFTQMFGSDGGSSDRIYYNPYDKDSISIRQYYRF